MLKSAEPYAEDAGEDVEDEGEEKMLLREDEELLLVLAEELRLEA